MAAARSTMKANASEVSQKLLLGTGGFGADFTQDLGLWAEFFRTSVVVPARPLKSLTSAREYSSPFLPKVALFMRTFRCKFTWVVR